MVTGASTADLALVLVDARKGVLEQSRRHAFLASLLRHPAPRGLRQQDGPRRLRRGRASRRSSDEFRAFAAKLDVTDLTFIPISALHGDNVVTARRTCRGTRARRCCTTSRRCTSRRDRNLIDARFPVQYVIRPHERRAPRLPRLRRHGRRRRVQAGRRGRGAAVGLHLDASRPSTTADGAGRRGLRADVGDDPPRRRHRRLPRRHDLPRRTTSPTSARTSRRWSAG